MKIEFSTINRLQIAVQSYGICTDATSQTPCHRQPGCCPVPEQALACLFCIGSVIARDVRHLRS